MDEWMVGLQWSINRIPTMIGKRYGSNSKMVMKERGLVVSDDEGVRYADAQRNEEIQKRRVDAVAQVSFAQLKFRAKK